MEEKERFEYYLAQNQLYEITEEDLDSILKKYGGEKWFILQL